MRQNTGCAALELGVVEDERARHQDECAEDGPGSERRWRARRRRRGWRRAGLRSAGSGHGVGRFERRQHVGRQVACVAPSAGVVAHAVVRLHQRRDERRHVAGFDQVVERDAEVGIAEVVEPVVDDDQRIAPPGS